MSEIAVIGAGAWGTALAIVLGRKGTHHVSLWAYEKEVCESISQRGVNQLFLPDLPIPLGIAATNNLEEALRNAKLVVSVMPSHHTRRIFQQMAPYLRPETMFVSATKGVENETLLRMSQVITEVLVEEWFLCLTHRCAQWSVVRERSCPRRSYRRHHRFHRFGACLLRAARVQ